MSKAHWLGLALAACMSMLALAQEETTAPADEAPVPATVSDASAPEVSEVATTLPTSEPSTEDFRAAIAATQPAYVAPPPPPVWPDLGETTAAWFAALVVLALTFRLNPLFSLRNLDGLVLAVVCLLLPHRGSADVSFFGDGHSRQWWAYLLLTVAGGYWLLRGLRLLLARRLPASATTVSGGALAVLIAGGLALGVHFMLDTPLSLGGRAGLVGGTYLADEGKLPYGAVPQYDNRSPLLYLVYAAALQPQRPVLYSDEGADPVELRWSNRDHWRTELWWESADLQPARLVNVGLFVLLLLGLYTLGQRLHSMDGAFAAIAILCVFPATQAALGRPEVMLPATLLTWSLALALIPGVGGLLGTLCLVLAGLAWPWAWLGLPVLLAWSFRRGWHALGSVIGLAVGVAATAVLLVNYVAPALPRADGALARAGVMPHYQALLIDDQRLVVRTNPIAETQPAAGGTAPVWRVLLGGDKLTLADVVGGVTPELPVGVTANQIALDDLHATENASAVLEPGYQDALASKPWPQRALAATRTVLESTWLSSAPAPLPMLSPWQFWLQDEDAPAALRVPLTVRQIVKIIVAIIVLWATLAVFLGRRIQPRQLAGGLLVVVTTAVLASSAGSVMNLLILLPLILTLWLVPAEPEAIPVAAGATDRGRIAVVPRGGEPRITTDVHNPKR